MAQSKTMNCSSLPETVDLGAVCLRPIARDECTPFAESLSTLEPWSVIGTSADDLVRFLLCDEQGARHYAIVVGDTVAGAASVRAHWLKGPYLEFLAVLPDFQRHGIGSALLQWLERHAIQQGAKNLWVCASHFNDTAIRLYTRHGFVEAARLPDLVMNGHAEVLLRKFPLIDGKSDSK